MICGSCRRKEHLACSQVECKCVCGNQPLTPKQKAFVEAVSLPKPEGSPAALAEKLATEELVKEAVGSMTDGTVDAEIVVSVERLAYVVERFTVAAAAESSANHYRARKFLELAERLQRATRLILTGKAEPGT